MLSRRCRETFFWSVARHVLANDVAAERQRKAGFLQPPRAHVGDEMQAFVLVGELAFVNQEPGIDVATLAPLLRSGRRGRRRARNRAGRV